MLEQCQQELVFDYEDNRYYCECDFCNEICYVSEEYSNYTGE